MLFASQITPIPLQSVVGSGDPAGKRDSVKDGDFSEIFDRSIRAAPGTGTRERRQSLHSANRAVASSSVSGPCIKTQTRAECSGVQENEKILSGNNESASGTVSVAQNCGETADTESALAVSDTGPDNELPLKRLEFIQGLLNDILALLLKFYQSALEPESTENNSVDMGLEEFKQQILLKLTEAVEFIKASEIPGLERSYADKLLQVLQNGFFEADSIGEEQIFIELINDLDSLVRKMLHETETVKLRIAGEIPSEFTAERTEHITEGVVHEQSERENTAVNQLSTEQTTDNISANDPDIETGLNEQRRMNVSKATVSEEHNVKHDFIVNTESTPADLPNEAASVSQTADRAPFTGLRQAERVEYQIIRQVIEKAETLLSENRTEMIIRLKPESLGKLTLRVIHERGEIAAGLIAENEQVKAVIESNLRFLEDSLRRSGVELQSLAVSVEQNGHNGQYEDSGRSYGGRTAGRKTAAPSPAMISDIHHTYRFEGTAEGLIQMQRPAIDLTA